MGERPLLLGALCLYAAAWLAPALGSPRRGAVTRLALALLVAGLALHSASLLLRWRMLGHGPFTTLHEILSSNLWSLTLAFVLSAALVREVRVTLIAATPVFAVLAVWVLTTDAGPGHLPPTYATVLLYLHTLVGKLFLGLLLVAVSLAAVPWLRRTTLGAGAFAASGPDARFDELAHRFAASAFVFDSLLLIVGAAWAQDAWGRYWAWDPLETWAFMTWLALAATLHARATYRPAAHTHAKWLLCVFVVAFLTFFGVPFLSTAPHQGAM